MCTRGNSPAPTVNVIDIRVHSPAAVWVTCSLPSDRSFAPSGSLVLRMSMYMQAPDSLSVAPFVLIYAEAVYVPGPVVTF